MKKVSLHGQLTFDEMKGSLERLLKTNRWVQMSDSLPWTEYEKVYNKRLKNDTKVQDDYSSLLRLPATQMSGHQPAHS
ncbi:MAG: hypothetical protein PUD47_02400 [Bacteroidales bacterium]|nr:hypothetical protein [Bacteroidales bacterium]